jgi:ADP-ribose pyrophosphatase YjhB (NUDIX family)
MNEPRWLEWARELQSIAQVGLIYATDRFDIERYRALSRVAAEIVACFTDIEFEQVTDIFDGETGYPTPKLAVRACCVSDDGLLLVRELDSGLWSLPGGVVEARESPGEAVVREVREESGYQVLPKRLLAAYDRAKQSGVPIRFSNYCVLFIECEFSGIKTEHSPLETSEARFFALNALPPLISTWQMGGDIDRVLKLIEQPGAFPEFD